MTTLQFIKANFRFLIFGILLTFFSSFGQSFFYGLFNAEIRETFNISNTAFGSYYGMVNIVSAISLMYFGQLIDRMHLRSFTIIAFLILGFGCLSMSLAASFPLFVIALFLTRFGGQGLFIHTNATSMGRYFHETRGRALSITIMGVQLGALCLPALVVILKKNMDWQLSWMIFAAAVMIFTLPLVLWLLHDHDTRHKNWEEDELRRSKAQQDGQEKLIDEWSMKHVVRDIRFYMLIPVLMINPIIGTGLFFYIQNVGAAKEWSMETIAIAFSVNAVATITFTIIGGFIVDKLTAKRMLIFAPIPMTFALLVLGFFEGTYAAYAFMIIMGLSVGAFASTSGSIWAEMYGTKHLGSIRSLFGMIMVFSTALMPPLMGYLFDHNVAISSLSLGLIAYVLLAGVLATPISISAWVKPERTKTA